MSSDIAIAVRNVSKVYHIYERPQDRLKQMLWRGGRKFHDEFWALGGIDFEVRRGETVGIIGRNGSGKSTLLQIVCGTVTPTTGTVERNGRLSALLELGSGFNPDFTGRENVFLNGSILGLSRSEMDVRFDRIAAFADIGQFIDSPVKHYSSGMFARLAFSVAIHVDPEILIVDEILAVGDAAFQRRCLSKFYEIRESGCAILFVSHDQYQVKSVCQRAVYLERGRQKLFGPAGRVIDAYTIDMEAAEAARARVESQSPATMPLDSGQVVESVCRDEKVTPSSVIALDDGCERPYLIESVRLLTHESIETVEVETGAELWLEMKYRALTRNPPGHISFVFNMYRHDDLYICGTTTLMDGMAPFPGSRLGKVRIRFPSFPLLSGEYKFRVAINDHGGFVTLAELNEACKFSVVDNFNAVGLIDLPREWHVEAN